LWRPNREKAGSVTTKWLIVLLLLLTAVLAGLITIGGWTVLEGGNGMGFVCAIYAILYFFFALLVARWRRGILPLAAALSMILAIFCAVGADSWFARDKEGFTEALFPSSVVGVLVIILMVVQLVVIVAALYGFNQAWNVEEERPIGNGEDFGAGSGGTAAPQPA
jgi:TRAP-type C4-dicarboxylate transport system permease small subunit